MTKASKSHKSHLLFCKSRMLFCASQSYETNFKAKIAPHEVHNKSCKIIKRHIFSMLGHKVIFCIF